MSRKKPRTPSLFNERRFYQVSPYTYRKNEIGMMVGRKMDPSYNEAFILFQDGTATWFSMSCLTRVERPRDWSTSTAFRQWPDWKN